MEVTEEGKRVEGEGVARTSHEGAARTYQSNGVARTSQQGVYRAYYQDTVVARTFIKKVNLTELLITAKQLPELAHHE
jgi:hypothetical protein